MSNDVKNDREVPSKQGKSRKDESPKSQGVNKDQPEQATPVADPGESTGNGLVEKPKRDPAQRKKDKKARQAANKLAKEKPQPEGKDKFPEVDTKIDAEHPKTSKKVKDPKKNKEVQTENVAALLREILAAVRNPEHGQKKGKEREPPFEKQHSHKEDAERLPAAPLAAPPAHTEDPEPTPPKAFPLAVRDYGTKIHKDLKTTIELIRKFGGNVRPTLESRDGSSNLHVVSAAVRASATAEALARLHEMGHRRCLSLWGSGRDRAICAFGNLRLPDSLKFHLDIHRPLDVAQDVNRIVHGASAHYDVNGHDSFLLVDVYETPFGPFSPNFVASHLTSGAETFMWLGHDFNGPAGVIHGEGAWMRKDGKIRCFPDASSSAYPDHDPCDWIFEKSSHQLVEDTLVWSTYRVFGSMRIVVFKKAENVAGTSQTRPPAMFELVDLPQVDWSFVFGNSVYARPLHHLASLVEVVPLLGDFVRISCPKKAALVHGEAFRRLTDLHGARERTILLYRQIRAAVAATLDQSAEYSLLRSKFSNELRDVTEHTTTAIFVAGIQGFRSAISSIRAGYGEAIADIKVNADSISSPKTFSVPKWILLLVSSAIIIRFRKQLPQIVLRVFRSLMGTKLQAGNITAGFINVLLPAIEEFLTTFRFLASFPSLDIKIKQMLIQFVVSAVIEEMLKKKYEIIGRYLPWLEFGSRIVHGMPLFASFPPLIMHLFVEHLPLKQAILVHVSWNILAYLGQIRTGFMEGSLGWLAWAACIALFSFYSYFGRGAKRQELTRFEKFKALNYEGPWVERMVDRDANHLSTFPPRAAFVPNVSEPYFPEKPQCGILKVRGSLSTPCKESVTQTCWIIPTSVPAYTPAATDANMLGVLTGRILVAPPLNPLTQMAYWSTVKGFDFDPEGTYARIDAADHVEEWIAHFEESSKRKKYMKMLELYKAQGPAAVDAAARHVDLFVKTNEVLMKFDSKGVYCKPRPIANIHPLVQLEVGPVIFEATKRFKARFSKHPEWFSYCGKRIYLTYAGAFTDYDLSEWFSYALYYVSQQNYFIIVSGDDSLVLFKDEYDVLWIMEGDASMYDQSESFGPLIAEYQVLAAFGVSEEVLQRLFDIASAPYHANARDRLSKIIIDRTDRPFRDTGGSDTSFGNSTVMAKACAHVVTHPNFTPYNAANLFMKLGLDMKIKFFNDPAEATFLKGMWYSVALTGGRVLPKEDVYRWWAPLPSRVLKCGKSLRDPRSIYACRDLNVAARMYLADVAQSYAAFASVPILSSFVRNFKGDGPGLVKVGMYKVQAAGDPPALDVEAARVQICARYRIEREDLVSVERLYPRDPFTFFEHPVFVRMAEVDYC